MSKLAELIIEYCPNGVPYKELSEIGQIFKGMSGVSKKWEETGNCQFIEYKNAYNNIKIDIEKLPFATVKKLENQFVLKKGDILFTSASETPDECAISSVIEGNIREGIFLDDHLFGIRLDSFICNSTYFNYYFRSLQFRKLVNKTVRGVTRYYISMPDFEKIKVPVPPIEVQNEIVRILDNFTQLEVELEVELEAELEAVKKQYGYYRDELLSFKDEVSMTESLKAILSFCDVCLDEGLKVDKKKLSEIGYFYGGLSGKSKSDFENGNAKFISYVNVFNNPKLNINVNDKVLINDGEKQNIVEYGDILFTGSSETSDECGMSSVLTEKTNEKLYLNSFSFGFRLNDVSLLNPEFSKFLFRSNHLRKQIVKTASGVTRFNVSKKKMENVEIPIPPIEIQNAIVTVLERFEKYANDLSCGLPAEIEKRKQQYEYYRDLLLNFEDISGVQKAI